MRKLCTTLLICLSLAGLGAGCGSSSTTSTTTNDHATTPATAPRAGGSNLNGSHVRTVSKADVARTNSFRHEGAGQTGAPPTGTWHLTFTGDSFRATDPTGFAVAQTYSATDAGRLSVILYVNPNQASFCGPDVPQNAAHEFSLSHNTLTLHAKDDGCADRDSILQGRWTRVGS
jgi:hypothetical protein